MTEETNTTQNSAANDATLVDRAKEALSGAGEAIRDAYDGVVDAAKENPKTAAVIAAGAAAAVAGAAFGATKLRNKDGSEQA
ncbi:hypothetical protein [Sphingomonas turrisvirgatae]|uniref:Uncharacterized protein n=1 Tax=Sphingomonas turrisvirgatae TaxID=1888892 RepID=A0A1E3LX38_9SPHN|nr:hypothetical protein [Sphingomonas turrisvirgatae]ODP38357.1 hypothetical protein BFL28_14610 [Sphingomonas turrisvirgatae]